MRQAIKSCNKLAQWIHMFTRGFTFPNRFAFAIELRLYNVVQNLCISKSWFCVRGWWGDGHALCLSLCVHLMSMPLSFHRTFGMDIELHRSFYLRFSGHFLFILRFLWIHPSNRTFSTLVHLIAAHLWAHFINIIGMHSRRDLVSHTFWGK